jgi:GT2 family glycosyltransferase
MRFSEKIGIVTVLYNSECVLEDFFESLRHQSYDNFLLYIIDNNSPDLSLQRSRHLAKTVSFKTIFIENNDNYGVAKGNNQGIEAALADRCDYILLSNNDVVLRSDTIEKLYWGLKETNADMVVPKIYYSDTRIIWAAGGKFNIINGGTIHFGKGKEDTGKYDAYYKIDYAPTCFMLIKRKVFFVVGLMDEKYFVYFDDTDFLYRARKKKINVFYIFRSVLEHKESISTGKKSNFSYYYNFRNRIFFAKKHRRFFLLFFFINLIWHYTVRHLKMLNNSEQWNIISKALRDGFYL